MRITQGTFSFLPDLSDEQIEAQINYALGHDWAISVEHSPTFALGVQWHPEWQVLDNPNYLKIFQAFGEACRQRAARRNQR